jgi:hypothetical protein
MPNAELRAIAAVQDLKDLQKLAEKYRIERDAYWQDLFEANRYSAWLAAERQNLLDRLSANPHERESADLHRRLDEQAAYIEFLEGVITEKEDQRFALENRYESAG